MLWPLLKSSCLKKMMNSGKALDLRKKINQSSSSDLSKEKLYPEKKILQSKTGFNVLSDKCLHNLFKEQEQFEQLIQNYSGPDPLKPRYDFINWIELHYLNYNQDTKYIDLLENTISFLKDDLCYKQDPRFIEIIIKYIQLQTEQVELYQSLFCQGLGTMCALLYISWADALDRDNDFKCANQVYETGIRYVAQPLDQLKKAQQIFQLSLGRRMLGSQTVSYSRYPELPKFQKLNQVSCNNVPIRNQNINHSIPLHDNNYKTCIAVNQDSDDRNVNGSEQDGLELFPSALCVNKLNTSSARSLKNIGNCNVADKRKTCFTSKFQVHTDENNEKIPISHQSSISSILKPVKVNDLSKLCPLAVFEPPDHKKKAMYPKQKIYAGGLELQLEELKAAFYEKLYKENNPVSIISKSYSQPAKNMASTIMQIDKKQMLTNDNVPEKSRNTSHIHFVNEENRQCDIFKVIDRQTNLLCTTEDNTEQNLFLIQTDSKAKENKIFNHDCSGKNEENSFQLLDVQSHSAFTMLNKHFPTDSDNCIQKDLLYTNQQKFSQIQAVHDISRENVNFMCANYEDVEDLSCREHESTLLNPHLIKLVKDFSEEYDKTSYSKEGENLMQNMSQSKSMEEKPHSSLLYNDGKDKCLSPLDEEKILQNQILDLHCTTTGNKKSDILKDSCCDVDLLHRNEVYIPQNQLTIQSAHKNNRNLIPYDNLNFKDLSYSNKESAILYQLQSKSLNSVPKYSFSVVNEDISETHSFPRSLACTPLNLSQNQICHQSSEFISNMSKDKNSQLVSSDESVKNTSQKSYSSVNDECVTDSEHRNGQLEHLPLSEKPYNGEKEISEFHGNNSINQYILRNKSIEQPQITSDYHVMKEKINNGRLFQNECDPMDMNTLSCTQRPLQMCSLSTTKETPKAAAIKNSVNSIGHCIWDNRLPCPGLTAREERKIEDDTNDSFISDNVGRYVDLNEPSTSSDDKYNINNVSNYCLLNNNYKEISLQETDDELSSKYTNSELCTNINSTVSQNQMDKLPLFECLDQLSVTEQNEYKISEQSDDKHAIEIHDSSQYKKLDIDICSNNMNVVNTTNNKAREEDSKDVNGIENFKCMSLLNNIINDVWDDSNPGKEIEGNSSTNVNERIMDSPDVKLCNGKNISSIILSNTKNNFSRFNEELYRDYNTDEITNCAQQHKKLNKIILKQSDHEAYTNHTIVENEESVNKCTIFIDNMNFKNNEIVSKYKNIADDIWNDSDHKSDVSDRIISINTGISSNLKQTEHLESHLSTNARNECHSEKTTTTLSDEKPSGIHLKKLDIDLYSRRADIDGTEETNLCSDDKGQNITVKNETYVYKLKNTIEEVWDDTDLKNEVNFIDNDKSIKSENKILHIKTQDQVASSYYDKEISDCLFSKEKQNEIDLNEPNTKIFSQDSSFKSPEDNVQSENNVRVSCYQSRNPDVKNTARGIQEDRKCENEMNNKLKMASAKNIAISSGLEQPIYCSGLSNSSLASVTPHKQLLISSSSKFNSQERTSVETVIEKQNEFHANTINKEIHSTNLVVLDVRSIDKHENVTNHTSRIQDAYSHSTIKSIVTEIWNDSDSENETDDKLKIAYTGYKDNFQEHATKNSFVSSEAASSESCSVPLSTLHKFNFREISNYKQLKDNVHIYVDKADSEIRNKENNIETKSGNLIIKNIVTSIWEDSD